MPWIYTLRKNITLLKNINPHKYCIKSILHLPFFFWSFKKSSLKACAASPLLAVVSASISCSFSSVIWFVAKSSISWLCSLFKMTLCFCKSSYQPLHFGMQILAMFTLCCLLFLLNGLTRVIGYVLEFEFNSGIWMLKAKSGHLFFPSFTNLRSSAVALWHNLYHLLQFN